MEIQDRILHKGDELFRKYGVKSVTMDDLARELSISKKTLYLYFSDKEEIIFKTTEANIQRVDKDMKAIRKNCKNAIDEVLQLMQYMNIMFGNMQMNLMYDLKKYYPKAFQTYLDFKKASLHQSILDNIKRGIKEGLYRKNIHPDIIARMRMEQVEDCFKHDVFNPSEYKLAEVEIQILIHYLFGLVSSKGYSMIEDYAKNKTLNKTLKLL